MFTASDVGWVVGHSYIVYAPLLTGATTIVYEASRSAPPTRAFWRIMSEYGAVTMFTAPTAVPRDQARGPGGLPQGEGTTCRTADPLPRRRAARPRHLRVGHRKLGVPVVDNWWQTETGWPIAANPEASSPPDQARLAVGVRARLSGRGPRSRSARSLPPATEGAICIKLPLPPGTFPTLYNDDERFISLHGGIPWLLPHRRRRLHRRGRLRLRHGPHRRCAQRRRPPPLDRVDRGRARGHRPSPSARSSAWPTTSRDSSRAVGRAQGGIDARPRASASRRSSSSGCATRSAPWPALRQVDIVRKTMRDCRRPAVRARSCARPMREIARRPHARARCPGRRSS
jgi:hypothetical protein